MEKSNLIFNYRKLALFLHRFYKIDLNYFQDPAGCRRRFKTQNKFRNIIFFFSLSKHAWKKRKPKRCTGERIIIYQNDFWIMMSD